MPTKKCIYLSIIYFLHSSLCVTKKVFPFLLDMVLILQKQLNLSKNAILKINCYSHTHTHTYIYKPIVSHINLRKMILKFHYA